MAPGRARGGFVARFALAARMGVTGGSRYVPQASLPAIAGAGVTASGGGRYFSSFPLRRRVRTAATGGGRYTL